MTTVPRSPDSDGGPAAPGAGPQVPAVPPDAVAAILAQIDAAETVYDGRAPAAGPGEGAGPCAEAEPLAEPPPWDDDSEMPSEVAAGLPPGVDPAVVAACAGLDHSDTDNGRRLIAHFGRDLAVLAQEGVRNSDYVAWAGTHWDMVSGNDRAWSTAQKLGALIALEADHLAFTPPELRAVEDGYAAAEECIALDGKPEKTDEDKATLRRLGRVVQAGTAAAEALDKRRAARRKFGVSSKNKSRLEAMLACAASHLTRPPDAFNADPLRLAAANCTLQFSRTVTREVDPECPDPDVERFVERIDAGLTVVSGHAREDWITQVVPVDYDPAATCPRWRAFLEEFLPSAPVREAVQVASGLGLLGLTEQKIVFHYGLGANGKSVFLETLTRLLGPLAIGLPAESVAGSSERGSGQASPDLARLFGKRFLRVIELPPDKPLHEDLVKKLTGGERIPVRGLFKAYFEFAPCFIGHMSGNGYPRIDGTDNGIWRRMVVVHWPKTLDEADQKPFDEVLAGFAPEYPGILNWLVDGALTYLREGLRLPDEIRMATAEYRDEMDSTIGFMRDCVERLAPTADGTPAESVTARDMYQAYVSWAVANAKKPMYETKFGRVMRTRLTREDGRIRRYLHCRLHDVPARPARNPDSESDYGANPYG